MFQAEFNQITFADLRLVLRSSQGGSRTSNYLASGGIPAKIQGGGDSNSLLASHSPPAKRRCTGLSSDDETEFYTHKVVLASSSPVMKAMLLKAKELRDSQAVGGCIRITLVPVECTGSVGLLVSSSACQLPDLQLEILELPMEQEELLACEVLLRSIYSGDLAEEVRSVLSSEQGADVSRVMLLVQVYRLADRFEVCTDHCAEAISALSSSDCESIDDVNYVFSLKSLAPALVKHATIKALSEKCLSKLVEIFGNIDNVSDDASLIELFRQLDCLTVLAFLDSDKLEVMSENDIVALMHVWIGDGWANWISKEHLGAFWRVLRLGDLTTSFLTNLTAIAPWLPVDPALLVHVAAWKGYQASNPVKAASMQKRLQSAHGSGVAWFGDKRKRNAEGLYGVIFTLNISKEDSGAFLTSVQLSEAQEDLRTLRTKSGVFNGYDFFATLSVQLVPDSTKKTFVVSVGFEVKASHRISNAGSKILVDVKARCLLGEQEFCLGEVDDVVDGTHAWELIRVNALDDFSCLGSYLDKDGNVLLKLDIDKVD